MSAELIAIIVMGISITGLVLVSLHRMEGRISRRIDDVDKRLDSIEARLRAVDRGQTELKTIVAEHSARFDSIERRFDSVEERLRAVEHGHSEILGSVNTMNQVVLATLQRQIEGEPVGAD